MMKNLFILISLVFVVSAMVSASDVGVVVTEKFSVADKGADVKNHAQTYTWATKVLPWLDLDIADFAQASLRGYYQFYYEDTKANDKQIEHQYDFDDVNVAFTFPGVLGRESLLSMKLGRSLFYDFSANVLAHKLDGVQLSLKSGDVGLRVGVGYSGLLFRKTNQIQISGIDKIEGAGDTVFLAPKRLLGQLEFGYDNLLPGQNIIASVIGQLDLRPDTISTGASLANGTKYGAAVNTAYAGIGIDGKIVSGLYYKVSGYLQFGKTFSKTQAGYVLDDILAGMGSMDITYFRPEFLKSRFAVSANISSGDDTMNSGASIESNTTGMNTFFTGIAKRSVGYVYSPQFGNSLVFDGSWAFKPVSGRTGDAELGLKLAAVGFMRVLNGVIDSDKALLSKTRESYLGTEFDLNVDFRPSSDLTASLKAGVFLPNTIAIDERASWKIGVDVSLGL